MSRNSTPSLRFKDEVGSCSIEPGEITYDNVSDCPESDWGTLLCHPISWVRVAALEWALMLRAANDIPRKIISSKQPGRNLLNSELQRHITARAAHEQS